MRIAEYACLRVAASAKAGIVNTFETHSIFPNPPQIATPKGQKTKAALTLSWKNAHCPFRPLNPLEDL